MNLDRLTPRDGLANTFHRAIHIPQQKRIVQIFQPGIEKLRRRSRHREIRAGYRICAAAGGSCSSR